MFLTKQHNGRYEFSHLLCLNTFLTYHTKAPCTQQPTWCRSSSFQANLEVKLKFCRQLHSYKSYLNFAFPNLQLHCTPLQLLKISIHFNYINFHLAPLFPPYPEWSVPRNSARWPRNGRNLLPSVVIEFRFQETAIMMDQIVAVAHL